MRASTMPFFTQREFPQDAVTASHKFLIKAGFIHKQGSGLYSLLPFGQLVYLKIEQIIREEMIKSGAIEVSLPHMIPAELWEKTGRWQRMGPELMRLNDRHENPFALGPTHEESITDLAKSYLQSYKQLPLNFFQIGTKFRDEIRPRFGLIRGREFVMKDAYSFHDNEECLEKTYQEMRACYRRIFQRCGLETLSVEADSGNMGGAGSEEFMVASEIGEEYLLICNDQQNCKYRGNQEKTKYISTENPQSNDESAKTVETPGCKKIEEVASYLGVKESQCVKAVAFYTEEELILAFVPGNKELNEKKLMTNCKGSNLQKAGKPELESLKIIEGFIGPQSLPYKNGDSLPGQQNNNRTLLLLIDENLKKKENLVTGANELDKHVIHINASRDFPEAVYADISSAEENDLCPSCKKEKLRKTKGIEVGHIFKLGKKYTESLSVNVLDLNGKTISPTMGCYGIGLGRTLATVVEQNHDDQGIIWPQAISPFQVIIISLAKKPDEIEKVEQLYSRLAEKFSVYLDDRKERPGVKFADAELVGIPIQIVAGKTFFSEGLCELKARKTMDKQTVESDKLEDTIADLLFKKDLPI